LFYSDGPRQQLTKVFWFFSSEKNTFLILAYMSQRHGGLVLESFSASRPLQHQDMSRGAAEHAEKKFFDHPFLRCSA